MAKKKEKSYDERGIDAIIALQKVAGLKETREAAERGWRGMDPWQREQTMLAFEAVCAVQKKR
jgi:hypothetical protein